MPRDALRAEIGEHAERLTAILRRAPALTMPQSDAALTDEAFEILEVQNAYEFA